MISCVLWWIHYLLDLALRRKVYQEKIRKDWSQMDRASFSNFDRELNLYKKFNLHGSRWPLDKYLKELNKTTKKGISNKEKCLVPNGTKPLQ